MRRSNLQECPTTKIATPSARNDGEGDRLLNVFNYKWWWSKIGGRPWTYILRDTWHKLEGLWIIALVAIGALLGHWLWDLIFWFLLVFALGFIAGHLFWGKEYIPDQKGK